MPPIARSVVAATVVLAFTAHAEVSNRASCQQQLSKCLDQCRASLPDCGAPVTTMSGSLEPEPEKRVAKTITVGAAGENSTPAGYEGALSTALVKAWHDANARCQAQGYTLLPGEHPRNVDYQKQCTPNQKGTEFTCKVWLVSASLRCRTMEPNPAWEAWRRSRDAFQRDQSQNRQDLDRYNSCIKTRGQQESSCPSKCGRPCSEGEESAPQRGEGASGKRGGQPREESSSSSSSNTSTASSSSSSTTSSVLSGASALTTGSTSSGGGSGVAGGAGAAGALGVLIGGAAGAEKEKPKRPTDREEYEALRTDVLKGKNQWQPAVFSASLVGAGLALYFIVDAINGLLKKANPSLTDDRPPTDFGTWPVLFGVDGPLRWWARPEFHFLVGVEALNYQGAWLDGAAQSGGDRGLALTSNLTAHFVGGTLRWGLLRASAFFLGAYGNALDSSRSALALRNPGTGDFTVPEGEAFTGLDWSVGLQLWQGLLSPYVEYRSISLRPVHRLATLRRTSSSYDYNLQEGVLWLPAGGALVIGNTFNFVGLFATSGPLRRSLVIDVSVALTSPAPISTNVRVGIGYTITWF